jgi:hypothetical protein
MAQNQYSHAHKARQDAGLAKPKGDNNSMTIDGNVVDESGTAPKVPPKKPSLPSDDIFLKYRTSQA